MKKSRLRNLSPQPGESGIPFDQMLRRLIVVTDQRRRIVTAQARIAKTEQVRAIAKSYLQYIEQMAQLLMYLEHIATLNEKLIQ